MKLSDQAMGAIMMALHYEKETNIVYDTFIFCRPDGVFTQRPSDEQLKNLYKDIAFCSTSEKLTVSVNSEYPKINADVDYDFLRINMHSPFITSRVGIIPMIEIENLYRSGWINNFKPSVVNKVKIYLDTEKWEIHIRDINDDKTRGPSYRPIDSDDEMMLAEYFKRRYEQVIRHKFSIICQR